MLRYFNFVPSLKLRWCRTRDLFRSKIPVTEGEFELRISCIQSSYLTHEALVFHFSKNNLKSDQCLILMVLLLDFQGMKSCKSRELFCLSILMTQTQMIGPLFDMLNMCKPRTGCPTSIWILCKWVSKPAELAWDGECRLAWFYLIEIFLQLTFIFFQGCPIKQAVFLPGQSAPYSQVLIQSLLLVPKCFFS